MLGLTPDQAIGSPCLRLTVRQGTALVSLHGGQVLSWVPQGGDEVLWLSPEALPPPAAIRGGVPICWPWFGKQGMPEGAMQHGPVRNRAWQVVGTPQVTDTRIQLDLAPQPAQAQDDPLARFAPALDLRLRVTLDDALALALHTHNHGTTPFALTQALHTYLAVGDVRRVAIAELAHVPFHDKLTGTTQAIHAQPWRFDGPCDRIYQHPAGSPPGTTYTVADAAGRRHIQLETTGSRSVVLWNPGLDGARAMADVPDGAWTAFVCLETCNAGTDVIPLAPGQSHTLVQRLTVTPQEPSA